MACYHPLKGFIIGKNSNGKNKMIVTSALSETILNPYYDPSKPISSDNAVHIRDSIPIPCGQCVGCRLEYSRQWAIRCMLETEYHKENYFLTLTYDDEHVVHSGYYDDDGNFNDSLTLYKKHLQDFNKRLRSALSYRGYDSFRFYACGEYGTDSARPHYHMIAFGLHLDDLQFYKNTPTGNLYNSPFLDKIWGHGHVVIAEVTFETCAYVSRYIMKKQKGDASDVYLRFNIDSEFTLMSRRPGIGKQYFDDNFKDIYPSDSIVIRGGHIVKPPKYFDSLMDDLDEQLMEDVKLKRSDIAKNILEHKLKYTTADEDMYLQHCENNKLSQIKKLVRPL